MADEPQMKGPNASTSSVVADFIGTVWGKVLTVLAAITMLLGIAAEGVSLYRNWWEAESARQQMLKTTVETDAALYRVPTIGEIRERAQQEDDKRASIPELTARIVSTGCAAPAQVNALLIDDQITNPDGTHPALPGVIQESVLHII